VVSASTITKTPSILIGRTGTEEPFRHLAEGLRREGYSVSVRPSSAVGAHSSGQAAQDSLTGVDLALLVVRQDDDNGGVGPVRPFQGIVREAGLIQGKLGMDKVVLLVEENVTGLAADPGVSVIRYPAGWPDAVLSDIVAKVKELFPPAEPGIHQKLARVERSNPDSLLMPFVLIGVVLLAALLGALIAAVRLSGGGGSDEATARLLDVTDALRAGTLGIGPAPSEGTGGTTTESTVVEGTTGTLDSGGSLGDSVEEGAALAGPTAVPGGSNQLFPATCQIDLSRDSLLDDAVLCSGGGQLILDGPDGPWHSDLGAVAVGDGVVGRLVYQKDGSDLALTSGIVVLDSARAVSGVSMLTMSFSAEGQHFHLMQPPENGGAVATLTFSLDR